MDPQRHDTTYRVRNFATHMNQTSAASLLKNLIGGFKTVEEIQILSLAPDLSRSTKTATVTFSQLPAQFNNGETEWTLEAQRKQSQKHDLIVDIHFRGFTPLNDVLPHAHTVDCIAISGLASHPLGSWKQHNTSFVWLRDELPEDMPGCRVIIYGYDTKLQESHSFQDIDDIGVHFHTQIKSANLTSQSSKRLVFLAHSLGGVVLKRVLVEDGRLENPLLLPILENVIFFGVPSLGMSVSHLQLMVSGQPNERLLHQLSPENFYLSSLESYFTKDVRIQKNRFVYAYETKESQIPKEISPGKWKREGPYKILVTRESATRSASRNFSINEDHSNMVKFSKGDSNYRGILGYLKDSFQPSNQEIRIPAAERSPFQKDCLKSLNFDEMQDRQNDVKTAEHSTCSWLVKHHIFQEWLKTKSGLLWIRGNPGTGKSTLMSYILHHHESQQKLTADCAPLIVSFFFHGRGSSLQKGRLGLFRALLYQLLDAVLDRGLDCADFLVGKFKKKCDSTGKQGSPGEPGKDWDWNSGELYSILDKLLLDLLNRRPLQIFVDALDECGEDEAVQLADTFENLTSRLKSARFNLQICFSCRHYPIITYHGLEICVERENSDDIETYVQNRLERVGLQNNLIKQLVLEKAAGVFQWVSLVLDRICLLHRKGSSPKQILREIERIPPDLEKLYREIIEGIEDEQKPQSLKLLAWLYFSTRPLTLGELRFATAIDLDSTCTSLQELQNGDEYVEDDETMERRVKDLSCGLVEIMSHEGGNVAQFIHQSVRDFMIDQGFRILEGSWETPQLVIANSHHRLARYCILFLALFVDVQFKNENENENEDEDENEDENEDESEDENEDEGAQSGLQDVDSSEPQIRFLRYTALSWTKHAQKADSNGIPQDCLLNFLQWPSTSIFDAWIRIYWTIDLYSAATPSQGMDFLHIAAIYGLESTLVVIFNLEHQYSVEADSKDKYGRTPLSHAAGRGHEAVVRLLVARDDVDADSKDEYGRTPLSLAARRGHEAVVRLLETKLKFI